ncbi:MAG: Lrp/AsnC ligand binding domain-containing protein [Pirellulales bacterium]|jgi:DNA-binding Lrp family transcriptional regulator|nr:Lrp/AsnC ligand binding domain-containing protein [Thermoguttaceae bacterium]MDD4785969.1 Lrp/AsnC ligand binding domain-containing protein [Pirellulales bacterium]MDI9444860.1 Lrp/AsnC ligand binding domain-containing protein [Planctomycetota bacterium]NLZ00239.1 Lrp/AsnC family transcriptional regulator [Pirellulaceae bacterium]
MIRALVMMHVERGKVPDTAKRLAAMDEVVDVYSVAGGYDLVAIIQSEEYQRLAEIVTEKLQAIETVTDTTTLMAFRNYKFTL